MKLSYLKGVTFGLTSGIITTLEMPDYETRVNIIKKKASEQRVRLSEEIIHLLAKYLAKDIRQIESALSCLKAKSELLKEKIDGAMAKEVIKCHIPEQNSVDMQFIRDLVCQYFKIDPLMLRSKSRKRIHTYPRNIYVYLCRRYTDTTVEEIGKSIDRNHSTVLYSSEIIEHKMSSDGKVKNQVDFLEGKLKSMTK